MDRKQQQRIKLLQRKIGYRFKNKKLLEAALTHKSYAFEHPKEAPEWNERLEFFGDSVLGLIISEYLYRKFKNLQEGELSKFRSQIVCTDTLYKIALKLNLGGYLLLGRGELHRHSGRFNVTNLSCVVEALIGAVYLDRGLDTAKKVIFKIFQEDLAAIQNGFTDKDYKSAFQDFALKKFGQIPFYELISQEGPEHKKEFVVSVRLQGQAWGKGWGLNKKAAQQMAAKEALERVDKSCK